MEYFNLTLELIFASNISALIQTKIDNKSSQTLNLKLEWTGNIFNQFKEKEDGMVYDLGQSLETTKNGIQVNFADMRQTWRFFSTVEAKFTVYYEGNVETTVDGNDYTTKLTSVISIEPKKSFKTYSTQSYTFTTDELNSEKSKIQEMISNPDNHFKVNNKRWQGYLDKTFKNTNKVSDPAYKNTAVKSIETLTTNWRSAAGALKHDGVVPSMSYKWFIGMWAWDSWKQAVATAEFDGELAKNNIRALFDYQIQENDSLRPQDAGTIVDCIFFNQDGSRGGDGSEKKLLVNRGKGPVWMDQALYGIEALQNYGYKEDAERMAKKMFNNAEGLMGDGPIRENYNPLTGEGLHTKNFSWSASAYYMMYKNTLAGDDTSSQDSLEIPR